MPDLEETYAALAQGGSAATLAPHEGALLLGRAERAARASTVQERLDGLRVAAALGGRDGLKAVTNFQRDAELEVRRTAFEIGLNAREDGLPILREAIADPDPALAIEALRRLALAADKAATTRARSALGSAEGAVRAAAAELLGQVAGPAVRTELRALTQDPELAVRAAATDALDRIEGRRERTPPQPWWGSLVAAASPTAPVAVTPPVSTNGPPPASPPPTDDRVAAAARALRALGSAEPASDRTIAALREIAPDALAAVMRDVQWSKEAEIARGFAIAARWLEREDWVATVRRLLSDVNPAVRAAAAEAFGVLGRGLAALRPLESLLRDDSPAVRVAAARAIAHLAEALGRPELTKPRVASLENDPHETVRAAVNGLLAPAGSAAANGAMPPAPKA
jgi:HEAT repeat protein